jgi:hypothetical protein
MANHGKSSAFPMAAKSRARWYSISHSSPITSGCPFTQKGRKQRTLTSRVNSGGFDGIGVLSLGTILVPFQVVAEFM